MRATCHRYVSSVFLCPEDGGSTFLPNNAEFLLDYVTSQLGQYFFFFTFIFVIFAAELCEQCKYDDGCFVTWAVVCMMTLLSGRSLMYSFAQLMPT